ncbi:MAG: cyclophilin-like fold protein [Butyricicoccus sp.]|nr:cyclophilin-like fold protein [Butyricicoccus sp.]
MDTPATEVLLDLLPLTLDMQELNGNEKYATLPQALPTDATQPGQIHTGDLMLYGSDCLVLFYEDFPTSYSYTPLGKIDDPQGLAQALGTGNVEVHLEIAETA